MDFVTLFPREFLEFALPFFFILAVVYGSLEFTEVFKNRGARAIISVVIAFVSISYPPVSAFIYQFLPVLAVFFLVFFLLGFILSIFKKAEKPDAPAIAMIFAILLIVLAGTWYNLMSSLSGFGISFASASNILWLIGILILIVIFYAAYKIEK